MDRLVREIVEKQNKELKEHLGEIEGIALYKWMHSEDNQTKLPMVVLDDNGEAVKASYCQCGVDKIIHEPWCKSLIVVLNKGELRSVVPELRDQWVLMKWIEPPSEMDWVESFGDQFPYPRQGYYMPVAAKGQMIALRRGQYPRMETTLFIIGAFLEQMERGTKGLEEETKERWKRNSINRKEKYRLMFKDFAPVGDDKPGTKHNVSLPSVEVSAKID